MRKQNVAVQESVSKPNRVLKRLYFNDLDDNSGLTVVNFIALGLSRSYDCDPKAELLNT